ncbi:MAG: VWA domain-containing protein [Bacteroidota bacterium]
MLTLRKFTVSVLGILLFMIFGLGEISAQYVVEANVAYSKAIALIKRGKEAKAIKHLKKVMDEEPNHDAACILLIKLHLAKDNRKQASTYIGRLKTIRPTSTKRNIERDYYLAFNDLLNGHYATSRKGVMNVITDIHKHKVFDFNLLARAYNALGYLDVVEHQSESDQKNRVAVQDRILTKAQFFFEEALRYKPNSPIAATNYNRVNTALRTPPNRIDPYDLESIQLSDFAPSVVVSNDYKTTADLAIEEDWLPARVRWVIEDFSNYDELIFMMDASGSMRVPSEINPETTRVQWMKNFSYYLIDQIAYQTSLGVIAVGGECGERPPLFMSTSTARSQLVSSIQRLKADGHTPVNEAMTIAPDMFSKSGKKRAILFITDGMESCEPELTCKLSAQLGQQGIELHILSFLDQASAQNEYISYTCMAESSGGSLKGINKDGVEKRDYQYIMEEQLIIPLLEKRESLEQSIVMGW